jgi:non-ribosomal peptide synthetase component F
MTHTLSQFEWLLSQVVDNPDRQIAEYSLVTAESQKILPDPTEALSSKWEGAVHAILFAQARRTPRTRRDFRRQRSLDLRELESRANKLANDIRAQGTVTGDIVAILRPPQPCTRLGCDRYVESRRCVSHPRSSISTRTTRRLPRSGEAKG